jgi:hypothetical protein
MKVIEGDNLILLDFKKRSYDDCKHGNFIVDNELAKVTCTKCDKEVNPIWLLHQMAINESRYERNRQASIEAAEALDKRVRTKCEHCKKMTRIRGH